MLMYVLKEDNIEVPYKQRYTIKAGVVLDAEERNPQTIKKFEDKEEALKELAKFNSTVVERSGFFTVEERYVEEVEYDEDDDEVSAEIIEFSKMSIEVVAKPSYETIKIVDNYKDAEEAVADYDGEAYWASCKTPSKH